jgi:uncharacterized delta-60 repeat protein
MIRRAAPAAFLASILLIAVPAAVAQAPGELDLDFSPPDGKLMTNFTTGFDSANEVLVQSDSKIVAVGMVGGAGGRFGVARYDGTGKLDTSFSSDGKAITNFTTGLDAAFAAALDGDGNIVAAGRAGGRGGRFALARWTPSGVLDPNFGGGDGKVVTNFTKGDDFAYGIAVQGDGKIVAVGRAAGSGGVMAIARYKVDGSLDTTFGGGDGKVTTNFTKGDDRADAVAIDSTGDIVVAGSANYFGLDGRFALARYDSNGAPVTAFSGDGRLTTNFTPGFDGAFAVAIQSDHAIVAAGQAGSDLGMARYSSAGVLDTAGFGNSGKVTTSFSNGADYADDVGVDYAGRILVAGAANFFGPNSKFALGRYLSDGSLDPAFSGDGKTVTDFTTGFDGAYSLAFTPENRVVLGGYAGGYGGRFAVARYFNVG